MEIPPEILAVLTSAVLGFAVAGIHVSFSTPDRPIWPIKLYLIILKTNQPKNLKTYAISRSKFRWREQFMAAAFIWFFIFLILAFSVFDLFQGY